MEEEKEGRQKIKEGEEEKPKMSTYPVLERVLRTQHMVPSARNPKRLGRVVHRAGLRSSIPTPTLRAGG